MANQLVMASPVSSYLQGRQDTQQNQLGQLQIQGARQQLTNAQDQSSREDQYRNALSTYLQGGPDALAQLYQADPEKAMAMQVQQNQLAHAQQVEKAKQSYIQAQGVLSSKAPARYMQMLLPNVIQQWAAHNGKAPEDMTDEDATQLAQETLAQAGSIAGIVPKTEVKDLGDKLVTVDELGRVISEQPKGVTPGEKLASETTRRGQNMTDARDKAKTDAMNNPLGLGGPSGTPTSLAGTDFLATLPKNISAQVKALSEGRMQFPSGFALKTPYWQQMLDAVAQYDPSFDSVNYNARAKTRADFTSGKNAQNIKALNTAIGHLGTLDSQISGTASHGLTSVNYLQNKAAQLTGSSGPTLFKQTAGALASELTQVFRGSGGAEADVKRYLEELDVNASQEQKKAAVNNIVDLLNSRLNAIGDQYNQGMGTTKDALTLLNPKAQKVLSRISGSSSADPALPADIAALLQKHGSTK